jgi:hypothetical protein
MAQRGSSGRGENLYKRLDFLQERKIAFPAYVPPTQFWGGGAIALPCGMPPFLFRCPNTGLKVQGWVADDPSDSDQETFEAVTCTACTRVHLVNPKNGKILGDDEGGG